ncbi:hypothetical protein TNCV_2366031 [Trichonephila clavipes]|nr:hypothetical protein TNCV_2366031 [Trichonephila clavipes]
MFLYLQQTFTPFEKILLHRPWYPHIKTGKWSGLPTRRQFRNQIIPRKECIGQAEPLNEGHLCVISDTSGCLMTSKKTGVTDELSVNDVTRDKDATEQAIRTTPWKFRLTKTDKPTAAKTNVKHTGFLLVIMFQSTNEPQSLAD